MDFSNISMIVIAFALDIYIYIYIYKKHLTSC